MRSTTVTDVQLSALLAVLDASETAIVVVEHEGRVVHANPVVTTTFGYAADDLVGRKVEVLLASELRRSHAKHRSGFLAAPRPRRMGPDLEVVGQRQDGTRFPVEVELHPLETGRGTWVVAMVTDLSSRRAYETLARMNRAILRSTDARELYQQTCQVAVEHSGFLGASVAVRGEGTSVEMVATAGRIDAYIRAARISLDASDPRGRGPTATALREGRSQFVTDFAHAAATTPWSEAAKTVGIRASATLPLVCQGRTVAALNLWADQPHIFDARMRAQLEAMAENVSFALDAFDGAERLAGLARQRALLLQRLVSAQDEERAQIAADVHDEPVQALAAASVRLDLLVHLVAVQAPGLEPAVQVVHDIVDTVSGQLRTLMFELEAVDVTQPLDDLLRDTAAEVLASASPSWTVECDDELRSAGMHLAGASVTQAVRIVREALLNVRSHAAADRVAVVLRAKHDGVEITVTDDGVGLGADGATSPRGHRGITTMRERAELAGGSLDFESCPTGTTVRAWLPREPDWASEQDPDDPAP